MLKKRLDNIKSRKRDFFTFIIYTNEDTFEYEGHIFPAAELPKVVETLKDSGYTDEDMVIIRIREV